MEIMLRRTVIYDGAEGNRFSTKLKKESLL
jgi:hypothetical protein